MSERNYWCLCDDNCKFPTMTAEQILAAIQQAMETGEVYDPSAAVVSMLREANAGQTVTVWAGTQAQYNALQVKDPLCIYIITDSTEKTDTAAAIAEADEKAEEARTIANDTKGFLAVSASSNSELDDALTVDWTNAYAEINKPRRVASSAANVPSGYMGGERIFVPINIQQQLGVVLLVGERYATDGESLTGEIWTNFASGGVWRGWQKIGSGMIHYSETEPTNWTNGDIWLKPTGGV